MSQMTDNGANLIIDALLMRMSELDRYSDDDWAIGYHGLKVLDVVVDEESCQFGVVHRTAPLSAKSKRQMVQIIGGMSGAYLYHTPRIRTIYETEGAAARAYLAKYFRGKV
ncbi:hypothetical protein [Moraxella bovoculi]|uniref:hypothetical protein n=1 Tax=Moraxella bovoculi TaxID=386891 RepID=UPI0006243DB4|nr:hypothetical protein [Moraxella bovoculi]AKG12275.1 hypothetical protein AAX07_10220 [Moraxella bovoculi]AKG14246.1 hypothetical protein AAX11_09755 [Moraxella bovoculi]